MKIAITGSNGFVGASLCRYFSQCGHQVLALGNQEQPHPNLLKTAKYLRSDITRPMPPIEADACIHTAALPSDTDTYKSLIISNVEGTLNVTEASKHCRHFIYISSSSVYDFKSGTVGEEDASLNSRLSDYGETKLLAEDIISLDIPPGQQRLILRPRAIYGPGEQLLLPRLLRLITGNKLLCPIPEGTYGSLTHIDNIGHAIELFIDQESSQELSIYNICDEDPYPLRETMLRIASTLSDKQLKVLPIPRWLMEIMLFVNSRTHHYKTVSKPVINSLASDSILDISRIKKELGYSPRQTLYSTLPDLHHWIHRLGGIDAYLSSLQDAPWKV